MELRIAAIDDLQKDVDTIVSMTKRFFSECEKADTAEVVSYNSGESFLRGYTKGMFDAVFMDICMDTMNGIELSRRVRAIDENVAIIFMSTTTEYVFETFDATPFGYLLKPFTFEQLSKVMKKVHSRFSKENRTITVKIPRSTVTVDLDSIFSVISGGHITQVNTTSGNAISSTEKYEFFKNELLKESNFLECNRGIIINLDCVFTIKNNDIVMHNDITYPLRTRNKRELVSQITRYISRKMKGDLL